MGRSILRLASSLPELNWEILKTIIDSETVDMGTLENARVQLLQKCPQFRQYSNQRDLDLNALAKSNQLLPRAKFSDNDMLAVTELRDTLEQGIGGRLIAAHRVCTEQQHQEKFSRAGIRSLFDIVGFQIVPRTSADLSTAFSVIPNLSQWKLLFVFNTTLFAPDDFSLHIGPSSSPFYRAVHFYLHRDGVCAEIQIRLRYTHEWARLHHAIVYKPQFSVPQRMRDAINQIGAVANYLDYTSILSE